MLGYFPVAVSFGLLAQEQGFSLGQICSTSLLMFSGAGQFLFLGLWQQNLPLFSIIALVLLLNSRHLFYGPALLSHFHTPVWKKPWLAFGLTDEVFALNRVRLLNVDADDRQAWYLGSAVAAYSSWNFGTWCGAVFGQQWLSQSDALLQSLAFALPALFLLLLMPSWKRPYQGGIVLTLLISATGVWFGHSASGLLIGSLVGTLYSLWRAQHEH